MTIDRPHAPTIACDGCRELFGGDDPDRDPKDIRDTWHRRGYDIIHMTALREMLWHQRINRRGQAIVEFALVLPIMMALLLAVLEAGSFGARWIGYAHLADTMTASAAATGTLPAWWETEAERAGCMEAAAEIHGPGAVPGAPERVELHCMYHGIAVNGLVWPVTIDEAIPD
jgi:TadE-like protein